MTHSLAIGQAEICSGGILGRVRFEGFRRKPSLGYDLDRQLCKANELAIADRSLPNDILAHYLAVRLVKICWNMHGAHSRRALVS